MGKIFDLDSPLMRVLSRMGDLMILNVIMTICCIPIITIGASVTAMHYVMLKLVRGEDGYIVKDFFKSFRMNFKQATIIWLIMILFLFVFVGDYCIIAFSGLEFPEFLGVVLMAIAILVFVVSTYIFPVLSRIDHTVKNTIKNGCIMSIMAVPKAILIAVLTLAPALILVMIPRMIPLVILFGFSLPGYLSAWLYSGTCKRFEPEQEEQTEDEEFHVVFDDEEIETEQEGVQKIEQSTETEEE